MCHDANDLIDVSAMLKPGWSLKRVGGAVQADSEARCGRPFMQCGVVDL